MLMAATHTKKKQHFKFTFPLREMKMMRIDTKLMSLHICIKEYLKKVIYWLVTTMKNSYEKLWKWDKRKEINNKFLSCCVEEQFALQILLQSYFTTPALPLHPASEALLVYSWSNRIGTFSPRTLMYTSQSLIPSLYHPIILLHACSQPVISALS